MKIIVDNIDWDFPDKSEGKPCPDYLPLQVVIEDPILVPNLIEDIDGEAVTLAEYLTNKYECCVCGFIPKLEGVNAS